jgi:hypothetical protein
MKRTAVRRSDQQHLDPTRSYLLASASRANASADIGSAPG